MQLAEILLIGTGLFMLACAVYLGRRQAIKDAALSHKAVADISRENASRLQISLMQLLDELQALSGAMTADLEGKLSELKELLHLADTTIGEMSASEPIEDSPSVVEEEEHIDREDNDVQSETELQSAAEEKMTPSPLLERYNEIFHMAEEGLTIDEIARRTQMGKGEIQLILSLRQED